MKKTILAAFLLFTVTTTFAQTDKGDWMAGGTFGFRTNKNDKEVDFSPAVGYFFAKRFAAGVDIQLIFAKTADIKANQVGIGPFARYYFGNTNFRPFAVTSIHYLSKSSTENGNKSTSNGYKWLLGAGGAAFLNKNVAFEGIVGYNYTRYASASSNTGFSLNFGFQVYINKTKMKSLKQGKINE